MGAVWRSLSNSAARGLACALVVACGCAGGATGGVDLAAGGPLDGGSALDGSGGGGDLAFAAAPHRAFPQLAHASSGGLLSPMRLVVITAAGDSLADDLTAFGAAAVASRWFQAVTAEYGVLPPSGSVHLVGAAFPAGTAALDATAVADYIAQTLSATASAPLPDGQTLYLLYPPDGVDLVTNEGCKRAWGYHRAYGKSGDGMAVVQRCQGGYETLTEALTVVGSHEIAEAAIDTGRGWREAVPSPSPLPWQADPWLEYENDRVTENGDLCIDSRILEGQYYYQRTFSNAVAAAGGDPCVPALPIPYYGATTESDWYAGAPGQTLTIPVTGWSTAPTASWILRASVQNKSDPSLAFTAAGRGATLDNGVTAPLTVTIPSPAPSGSWAAIYLLSEHRDASGHLLPDEDIAHLQMVGVYVP